MLYIRKNQDRGRSQNNWLNSLHTFSFADYYDPEQMGFGHLRVINEDTVQAANGFGKHPHQDMEIISYVVEGSLEHRDSMGTGSIIKPGEIQVMSAGTGIEHSEFNHSKTDPLHFLQIWIIPKKKGLKPNYQQKIINKSENQLTLIAGRDEQDGAVLIHQDIKLYAAYLTQGHSIDYVVNNDRAIWVQMIKGKVTINEQELQAGDGAAMMKEKLVNVQCVENAELLFFDLAAK